jgi:hypothetical protein
LYLLSAVLGPSENRPVIFLQHGLEDSSTSWVANLPTQSAGEFNTLLTSFIHPFQASFLPTPDLTFGSET